MNTTLAVPSVPSRTRRVLMAMALTLVSLIATMAMATPADAYTITSRNSVPVAPTIYRVQGAHYNAGSALTGPMYKPWVYQPGPTVFRTTSGTQYVQVRYLVDRWNGSSWSLDSSQTRSTRIDPGYTSARAPALSVLPAGGRGYYRVRMAITYTSAIGGVQGWFNTVMNHSGDYTCNTTRTCQVGPGYVFIGS